MNGQLEKTAESSSGIDEGTPVAKLNRDMMQKHSDIIIFEKKTRAEKRLKRLQRRQARREEARNRILSLPEDHPERLAYRGSNLQDAKDRVTKLQKRIEFSNRAAVTRPSRG
jgi:hypothetical protein